MKIFALTKSFSSGTFFGWSPIQSRMERDVKILRVKTCLFGDDYEKLRNEIESAQVDAKVRAILIDFDSDGGQVSECAETADIIRASRKPVIGYVSGNAASAAYWLAASCTKIIAHPTAFVGSIGVYCFVAKEDDGKYVVSALSPNKLAQADDEQSLKRVQSHLDGLTLQFQTAVAAFRNTDLNRVQTQWGKGDVLAAADAATQGMIDALGNFKDALAIAGAAGPMASASPDFIARRDGQNQAGGKKAMKKYFAVLKARAEMTPEENEDAKEITAQFLQENHPDVYAQILAEGIEQGKKAASDENKETEEAVALADLKSLDEQALVAQLREGKIAIKDFPLALLKVRQNPSETELKRRAQGNPPANAAIKLGLNSDPHNSGAPSVTAYGEAMRAEIKATREGARRIK